MSMNRSVEDERLQAVAGQAFREHWVLFLVEGIALLILGVLAVVIPVLATTSLIMSSLITNGSRMRCDDHGSSY